MVMHAKAALDAICADPRYLHQLPAEAGMSLAVPVRRDGKRHWSVFLYPVFGTLGDRTYGPPRWRADVDAESGATTFAAVEPSELGFAVDKDAKLGRVEDRLDLTRDYAEYEKDTERYYKLVDEVAAFADAPRDALSGIDWVKVEALRKAFRNLAFAPMLPAYRKMNAAFFQWLLDASA
jgi:hypothetical protein